MKCLCKSCLLAERSSRSIGRPKFFHLHLRSRGVHMLDLNYSHCGCFRKPNAAIMENQGWFIALVDEVLLAAYFSQHFFLQNVGK